MLVLARFPDHSWFVVDILGGSSVINTLNLDQGGLGVDGVAATLVAQVTTPTITTCQRP
jgi:hypothetical protein